MNSKPINILLAEDDSDDCLFFKKALTQIELNTNLVAVHDGEQLMKLLVNKNDVLSDVLFLDLNMPRKNGFECLSEIKSIANLNKLPVIVLSTSFEKSVVNTLYESGANYLIKKPAVFSKFKNIILQSLTLIKQGNISQPTRENFVL